ncbi:MAG: putative toxin-antitoxin system toxin component, PIN family [Treponema sp.]|nr:putative toxin-antitoxin system toxin component, PIN family [Treponema sp.]MBR6913744.1 putative toxin-antitoxin system toxin component, PIN family [Treponema sp.]
MSFYAVIDTNVLVSAFLKSTSVPHVVLEYVFAGSIVPLYNNEILAEYKEVLNRPKFHFPKEAVEIVVAKIKEIGIHFDAIPVDENLPDPKDIVFYAVTMNARAENDAYLVTGNIKHFPEKPFVVTPRQMLDIVEK